MTRRSLRSILPSAPDRAALVPAAVLGGVAWFLLELTWADASGVDAVVSMARTGPAGAAVLIAAILLTAEVLRPFQGDAVRLLEGRSIRGHVRRDLLTREHRRLQRLDRAIADGPTVVDELRAELHDLETADLDSTSDAERRAHLHRLAGAHARLTAAVDALDRARRNRAAMPADGVLLPLPLGNRLRAHRQRADRAVPASTPDPVVRRHVTESGGRLGTDLGDRWAGATDLLDAACSLTLGLLVLGAAALWAAGPGRTGIVVSIVLLSSAGAAHRTALRAADRYGDVLLELAVGSSTPASLLSGSSHPTGTAPSAGTASSTEPVPSAAPAQLDLLDVLPELDLSDPTVLADLRR